MNWSWLPSRISLSIRKLSLLLKLSRDVKSSVLASSLLEVKLTLTAEDFVFDGSISIVWCDARFCCAS